MTLANYPDWLLWSSALDDETCDRLIEICKKRPVQEASTFAGDSDHRKTDIRWIPNEDEWQEVHNIMSSYALQANQTFGVSLTHLPPIQFTEYADVGHHYDYHHDIDWGRQDGSHRKISIVVQLTDPEDYEGGDFSFKHLQNPNEDEMKARGSILCFIPYHYHAVSPITSGSRISLVGWFEGPRWR